MPVRCLTDKQKYYVIRTTRLKTHNQTELAARFKVSRRTIQRVLIAAGLLIYNDQERQEAANG